MNIALLIKTALRSFFAHKMRSVLTTLGIIIGVAALIAVKSIGDGARQKVQKQIENIGTNFVVVIGTDPKALQPRNRGGNINLSLKEAEFKTLMQELPEIDLGSPGIFTRVQVVYENRNRLTNCAGVNEHAFEIRNWPVKEGSAFCHQDIVGARKVVLLGKNVAQDLFGQESAIGKNIRINRIPYQIIGILSEKGKRPDGADEDDIIWCPCSTVQRRILGVTDGYSTFIFSIKDRAKMATTVESIKSILRFEKKLATNADDTFSIFSQDEIARASDAASMALRILLIIIASISLLVGGIGIMNIMLVTVAERTKEIGLRLALGATKKTIMLQFVVESIIVCLIGGLIGTLLGVAIATTVGKFLDWAIQISYASIGIAFSVSMLIGVFFGLYPAKKAANMNPVEALLDR